MVFEFFRKPDAAMDGVETRAIAMLNDARHSFDLATMALVGGASIDSVADDIRTTDTRINQAEQDLRSELVVHVSVHGAQDIGLVMGYTLLIKKIERIGDQAKNILDLAEEDVHMSHGPDVEELMAERQAVSALFAEAAELLSTADEADFDDYRDRAIAMMASQQEKINDLTHTDRPGREAVPRAIYYRYLRRIVANLLGVVSTAVEPLPNIDYLDDGETDITDD